MQLLPITYHGLCEVHCDCVNMFTKVHGCCSGLYSASLNFNKLVYTAHFDSKAMPTNGTIISRTHQECKTDAIINSKSELFS